MGRVVCQYVLASHLFSVGVVYDGMCGMGYKCEYTAAFAAFQRSCMMDMKDEEPPSYIASALNH